MCEYVYMLIPWPVTYTNQAIPIGQWWNINFISHLRDMWGFLFILLTCFLLLHNNMICLEPNCYCTGTKNEWMGLVAPFWKADTPE